MVSNLAGLSQGLDDNLLNIPLSFPHKYCLKPWLFSQAPSSPAPSTITSGRVSLENQRHATSLLQLPMLPQTVSCIVSPKLQFSLFNNRKRSVHPPSYSCPHRKQTHPPSLSMPSGFLLSDFRRDRTFLTIFCGFTIRLPERVSILHTSSSIFLIFQLIPGPLLLSFNWNGSFQVWVTSQLLNITEVAISLMS